MISISPMLLETATEPFDSAEHLYEPKIDGHRLLIIKKNELTRIFTKSGNEVTHLYPELWSVPVEGDVILDGEGAVINPDTANFDYELMQKRSMITKKDRIRSAMKHLPVTFYCFDILRHHQRDLRGLPLIKRKSIQESVFTSSPSFSPVTYVEERGKDLYQIICDRKMEGIVAKRMNSMYVSNRTNAWLKIVNWTYEEIYITGYRKKDFGWVASVPTDKGEFRSVGVIEDGVTPKDRMAFYSVKDALNESEDQDYVYIQPQLKARVKILNWTHNGMLRSPVFVEFIQ